VARDRQIETGTGGPVAAHPMRLSATDDDRIVEQGWIRLVVDTPYRAEEFDVALVLVTDLHIPSFTGTGIDQDLSGAYSDRCGLGENWCGAFAGEDALAKIPAQALVGIIGGILTSLRVASNGSIRRLAVGYARRILAIGAEAKQMLGRTPGSIVAIRPLKTA